jgi:hypothetical protein
LSKIRGDLFQFIVLQIHFSHLLKVLGVLGDKNIGDRVKFTAFQIDDCVWVVELTLV